MENNWHKHSKRKQKSILTALGSLYGDVTPPTPPLQPPKPKVPPKRRERIPERAIQVALVAWAHERGLPLIAIPNEGKRSAWAGRRMVEMGLTRGVSDLFLAMPNHAYHGFWIELKSKGQTPRPEQWEWINKMCEYGYKAEYYDNLEEAKADIEMYLA